MTNIFQIFFTGSFARASWTVQFRKGAHLLSWNWYFDSYKMTGSAQDDRLSFLK
jgi:hypothetical protein